MGRKKAYYPPLLGGSSLLVIFSVLCLVCFALLSMSTVRASEQLSLSSEKAVTAYYQADARAEELLARLRCGEVPDGVAVSGNTYSYACPISPTQQLSVVVALADGQYQILEWQATSTAQWQADGQLPVWTGTEQS